MRGKAGMMRGRAGMMHGRAGMMRGRAGMMRGRAGMMCGRAGMMDGGRGNGKDDERGDFRCGGNTRRWQIERSRGAGDERMRPHPSVDVAASYGTARCRRAAATASR